MTAATPASATPAPMTPAPATQLPIIPPPLSTELTEAEFGQVRQLLAKAAGLDTDGSRRAALASVVRDLRDASGCSSTADYLERVAGDPAERQRLVEASVIGETHWLRTPPQIEALRSVVLPRLLAARGDRPMRIWSAGCASGEEIWTLAMLAVEAGALPGDVEVVGTDVSGRAVRAAGDGEYGERSLQLVDDTRRTRFLDPVPGAELPTWRVRENLRALVSVRQHDLVNDPLPFALDSVDLILCRNVTIYFSRETTAAVVDRLLDALQPEGTLVLGHSETLWQVTDRVQMERIGDAFTYRLAAGAAGAAGTAGGAGVPAAASASVRLPHPSRSPVGSQTASGRIPRPGGSGMPAGAARATGAGSSSGAGAGAGAARRASPLVAAARAAVASSHRTVAAAAAGALAGIAGAAPRPGVASPRHDAGAAVRSALAAGDYVEAERMALAGVAADPMSSPAHYLLGLVLATTGRDDGAVAELRKATYADPTDGLAQFLLATSLANAGHADAARVAYAAAADALLAGQERFRGASELGGRSVSDLAELCRRLAAGSAAETRRRR